jgi:hypothetical protein
VGQGLAGIGDWLGGFDAGLVAPGDFGHREQAAACPRGEAECR